MQKPANKLGLCHQLANNNSEKLLNLAGVRSNLKLDT